MEAYPAKRFDLQEYIRQNRERIAINYHRYYERKKLEPEFMEKRRLNARQYKEKLKQLPTREKQLPCGELLSQGQSLTKQQKLLPTPPNELPPPAAEVTKHMQIPKKRGRPRMYDINA